MWRRTTHTLFVRKGTGDVAELDVLEEEGKRLMGVVHSLDHVVYPKTE